MEDVRIGRSTGLATTPVTIPSATWTAVVKQDPTRYSLRFLVKSNVGVVLIPSRQLPTGGPTDLGGQTPSDLPYNLQDHGAMVTEAWYCYQSLGNCTVWATETFLGKE